MSAALILDLPRRVAGSATPLTSRMAGALARLRTPAAPAPRRRNDSRLLSELDDHLLRDMGALQSRIVRRRALNEAAPRAEARNGG